MGTGFAKSVIGSPAGPWTKAGTTKNGVALLYSQKRASGIGWANGIGATRLAGPEGAWNSIAEMGSPLHGHEDADLDEDLTA